MTLSTTENKLHIFMKTYGKCVVLLLSFSEIVRVLTGLSSLLNPPELFLRKATPRSHSAVLSDLVDTFIDRNTSQREKEQIFLHFYKNKPRVFKLTPSAAITMYSRCHVQDPRRDPV